MFFNVVCVSWKLKCWVLLMHAVTMNYIYYIFLYMYIPQYIVFKHR